MSIQDCIKKYKLIQKHLLLFLDDKANIEENFQNLIHQINTHKVCENRHDFRYFLSLIVNISNYHYRHPNFYSKIEKVIKQVENSLKIHFSNDEIFKIFKENKRLVLFLIEEKLIIMNDFISSIMNKYQNKNYPQYFYPEIKPFIKVCYHEDIENFEEKRKKAENEDFICELIRNDSIEDFIIFVKKNDFPLSYQIPKSLFDTNPLLLKKSTLSLFEYAAFFGAIQIFKYLILNSDKSSLNPSLWIYAVHGEDPEIISILEENKIKPEEETYEKCLKESIKMFSNDMTKYILNNYMNEKNVDSNITRYCFQYYNFDALQDDFINDPLIFFYLCDYCNLVELYLKDTNINLNIKMKILINQIEIKLLIEKIFI